MVSCLADQRHHGRFALQSAKNLQVKVFVQPTHEPRRFAVVSGTRPVGHGLLGGLYCILVSRREGSTIKKTRWMCGSCTPGARTTFISSLKVSSNLSSIKA